MMRTAVWVPLALTLSLATPAAALEPLSSETYINDRLIAARVADLVRKTCPTIDGRMIYAYSQARQLERYALEKGYSPAQIKAFLGDKAERRRIYAVADDYMARQGVKAGDAASYCKLGTGEIARRSIIGSLLVAR